MARTGKTIRRYLLSILERRTGWTLGGDRIEAIVNFRALDSRLLTGGQPDARQIAALARNGVTTVINLAPDDGANALPGERDIVAACGMRYVHIPVDFKKPTEQDFTMFTEAMDATTGETVFVHCAANMRVSAFLYRYRVRVLRVDEASARRDLDALWKPNGPWEQFTFGH